MMRAVPVLCVLLVMLTISALVVPPVVDNHAWMTWADFLNAFTDDEKIFIKKARTLMDLPGDIRICADGHNGAGWEPWEPCVSSRESGLRLRNCTSCDCKDKNQCRCHNFPEYCNYTECDTRSAPGRCLLCEDTQREHSAYHLSGGQCTPKCNWLGNWCHPGTCDEDNHYLYSTCNCSKGFLKEGDEVSTKCKLNHPPDILSCRSYAESEHGEIAQPVYVDADRSCESVMDTFVNFIPTNLMFEYEFTLDLPVDDTGGKHVYIGMESFGVVEASVNVVHYDINGTRKDLSEITLPDSESNCTIQDFSRTKPTASAVTCTQTTIEIAEIPQVDGERYCLQYAAVASGYIDITDMITNDEKRHYDVGETSYTTEKCFITDLTSPDHCANNKEPCDEDVLEFGLRIRRDTVMEISFSGWFDPLPEGSPTGSSGMKEYHIQLREMIWTPYHLSADFIPIETIISEGGNVTLVLPDRNVPSIYAIYLWALDSTQESSNYRIARRFVLSDNVSTLQVNETFPIIPTKASKATDFKWQTTLEPIKLDWNNHFYNTYHRPKNLLLPITTFANISGVFDQEEGELPVGGTPNVDGIVNFWYNLTRVRSADIEVIDKTPVPQPLLQQLTITELALKDGDTVHIEIQAVDIMNNTLVDKVTLHVDSSPPEADMLGLSKDGVDFVYVHNASDLTKMNMTFLAYDIHSGLKQIKWTLGTEPSLSDIGNGALPIVNIAENETCGADHCLCPSIGLCQMYNFSVPLDGLLSNVTDGDHNRNYYFHFEITNEALLISHSEFEILIDVSPPEVGYVFDGPYGSPDRDFQSTSLLSFYWTGFIDHESGISKYRYGIGQRCFVKDDLITLNVNGTDMITAGDVSETSVAFEVDAPGFYCISVIAYNGAMQPSDAVCSDGLTIDQSPPQIQNISMKPAAFPESVICANHTAYFMSINGEIEELQDTTVCLLACQNTEIVNDYRFKKKEVLVNSTLQAQLNHSQSTQICSTFELFNNDSIVFLPSTEIEINWDILEPDSQMLDYLVAFSDNSESSYVSTFEGFTTTHNITRFKCSHCGFGHGNIFFINIVARNKANLDDHVVIGPVIIDLTEPEYTGGMEVILNADDILLVWKLDSFVDMEDDSLILSYDWAIGTAINPTEVVFWQSKVFSKKHLDQHGEFSISYPSLDIETHDQGLGQDYMFTLKAYNRAKHYTVSYSEKFKVKGSLSPVGGIVYHVDRENQGEIFYQNATDYLCATWVGFGGDITVGVGTTPNQTDVWPLVNINHTDTPHCFDNLDLQTPFKYYVILVSTTEHGRMEVSSKGITVASNSDIYSDAKVNNGHKCADSEAVAIVPESNTILHSSVPYQLQFNSNLSSWIYHTIKVTVVSDGIVSPLDIIVSVNLEELIFISKEGDGKTQTLQYNWKMTSRDNTLVIMNNGDQHVTLYSVYFYRCLQDSRVQSSATQINANWYFNSQVQDLVSHYAIYFSAKHCQGVHCQEEVITGDLYAGKEMSFTYLANIHKAYTYISHVKPCFITQCLEPVESNGIILEDGEPLTGIVEARLLHQDKLLKPNEHILSARWDHFLQLSPDGYVSLQVYDWALALDESGHSLITSWSRVVSINGSTFIEVEDDVYITVQRERDIFFVLWCQSLSGMVYRYSSLTSSVNQSAPKLPQVFDLSADTDLEPLKDILHSENLGPEGSELYSNEIDFYSNTEAVSGAILGIDCELYHWTLQESKTIDCLEEVDSEWCISQKQTDSNVVAFKRLRLTHNVKYYICVQATSSTCDSSRSCSNGFIVDIHPPLPGSVDMGLGPVTGLQSDTSVTEVVWSHFYDIEEVDAAYGSGIAFYEVAIGGSPGDQVIHRFSNVGSSEHALLTGLNMSSGAMYFATVRACDYAGLCTDSYSEGLLIDDTPPTIDVVNFYSDSKEYTSRDEMDLIVSTFGVEDNESGVSSVMVAVGSNSQSIDVMSYQEMEASTMTLPPHLPLHDGHFYRAHIKATNRLGLWSVSVSEPLLVDLSPPITGFIRLGSNITGWYLDQNQKIEFYWGNFSDPHSGIMLYRIAIGSHFPGESDILGWTSVGLTQEFSVVMHLGVGIKHYISVEACNGAMLCSIATSPPVVVDISPPTAGIVYVGNTDQHDKWLSSRTYLSAHWTGMEDPESAIHHYNWCLGTSNSTCDVIEVHNVHKSTGFVKTNIFLPIEFEMCLNIIAVNNAGLKTSSSSKYFQIDETKPVAVIHPTMVAHVQQNVNVPQQIHNDQSFVSLYWEFQDHESPITKHVISLKSHHDGEVTLSNVIFGDIRNVTIPLNMDERLSDGSLYAAVVTACNSAGLCTSETSSDTLIDSSPPIRGSVMSDMTWKQFPKATQVHIKWRDFCDPHSQIHRYFVTVSSAYNGHDLSGGLVQVFHTVDQEVQDVHMNLSAVVEPNSKVVVNIIAENYAGLLSDGYKATLILFLSEKDTDSIKSGPLEIVHHSCDIHYCTMDCSCAPMDQICIPDIPLDDCIEYNSTDVLQVYDSIEDVTISHTASSMCLHAFWKHDERAMEASRYTWSISQKGHDAGFGVFNTTYEKFWFDNELYSKSSYCLPHDKSLLHGQKYTYHTRVWYSFDEYVHAMSPGVLVDVTPPNVKLGMHVLDMDSTFTSEVHFTSHTGGIYATWKGVFEDPESEIQYYIVSIGITPGGNEIMGPVYNGLNVSMSYPFLLTGGETYYTTVYAYNSLQMVTSSTSKGFIVDTEAPTPGTVYTDTHYQNRKVHQKVFRGSWIGFNDLHSYILEYHYRIIPCQAGNDTVGGFENAGIRTEVDVVVSSQHMELCLQVYAKDAAGFLSDVVTSEPFWMDTTPPETHICNKWEAFSELELVCNCSALLKGHHLEMCQCSAEKMIVLNTATLYNFKMQQDMPLPFSGYFEVNNIISKLHFGRIGFTQYLFEQPYFTEKITSSKPILRFQKHLDINAEMTYNVTVDACKDIEYIKSGKETDAVKIKQDGTRGIHVIYTVSDSDSPITNIQVRIGTTRTGSQIVPLRRVTSSMSFYAHVDLFHSEVLYPTIVVHNAAGLWSYFYGHRLVVDLTPPVIVSLQVVLTPEQYNKTVNITAHWTVMEDETEVTDCEWKIGHSEDSTDILHESMTDTLEMANVTNVSMKHGEVVHVTVKCFNLVGLAGVAYSKPTYVILDPPHSTDGYIRIYPKASTHYTPRNSSRPSDSLEFSHHNLATADLDFTNYYEASVDGGSWSSIDKLDHLSVSRPDSMSGTHQAAVGVRAINREGSCSKPVFNSIFIDESLPQLTGKDITCRRDGTAVLVNWSDVFDWQSEHGSLLFEIFVGSKSGMADITKALITDFTSIEVSSEFMKDICFVAVNGITPSGLYQTKTQLIEL